MTDSPSPQPARYVADETGHLVSAPLEQTAPRRPRSSKRAKSYRDTGDVAAATARLVRVVGRRVAQEDPAGLAELRVLEDALREAWSTAIAGLRTTGASDAVIGEALGVSKQAIAKRWPRNETI